MNHGLRHAESDADQNFVGALAEQFGLPFHTCRVDTPAFSQHHGEGIEEAARHLRYEWFWRLLATNRVDAVVTAHTLDDQAETVLHRLLRGAWTEGLGGIYPVLQAAPGQSGKILRPFLAVTRREIEVWLTAIGQPWREDSTNRDITFTRNRLRQQLLPVLAEYNPAIRKQFARLASLARDEEAWWQAEVTRLLPSLILHGRPVRGGGRATSTLSGGKSLSVEIERLKAIHPALRRRVLRAATFQLGFAIDFGETESLLALCGLGSAGDASTGKNGSKLQMGNGLQAERTPRELKLQVAQRNEAAKGASPPVYELSIPGEVTAPAYGFRLEATIGKPSEVPQPGACLRASRPGDRIRLRHSRSPMKIPDAFKRLGKPDAAESWSGWQPVLVWRGEIVWVPGLEIESEAAREAVLEVKQTPLNQEA
jgi:tRNA(Ile)-lysidine synthase